MQSGNLGKWTPAIIAGAVFAAVVVVTLTGGDHDAAGSSTTPVTTLAVTDTTPMATTSTIPGYTTTTLPFTPLSEPLGLGMAGSAVKDVQQRLTDLHFDPGPVDGYFGEATRAAVWAYEKLILGVPREQATGQVTPEMWASMHQPVEVLPKRPNASPTHLEVYLVPQVAVLFEDDQPKLITHISSGSGEDWEEEVTIDPDTPENPTEEPITKVLAGKSYTPGGIYTFYRRYVKDDGWRNGALGRMFKPVYFNYGIAVHGAGNVPNRPASHGCVRIPMHIADYFPDLVGNGDQVYVFDGVHDPEYYGSPPPYFDRDVTPTTTSTTTTTTTTTVPSTTSTTTAPTTTTDKPATTTTTTTTTTTSSTTTTTVPPSAVIDEPAEVGSGA